MDLHEEIRKVAYELYEKSGRTGGRELENWLEAERIVMARRAQGGKRGKAKTHSPTQQEKPPVRSRAGKPASKDKGPVTAEARKPRAKKTGQKKAAKTSR